MLKNFFEVASTKKTDTHNALLRGFFSVFILITLNKNSSSQNTDLGISNKIDTLIRGLYDRGQFNGSVLVSVNEKIVYEKAYGRSDFDNNIAFSISTPCYLASVSKQFTAAGILILAQKNLITLDDHIDKYFPSFPEGESITIRQLLNHTSGIVNYEELGIDNPRFNKSKRL
jgi:CubicO group peptidase (beta-lactamase class C family)